MCFTGDQHPPPPPVSSEVGRHGPLVLTAGDGNRLSAFEAVPVTPRGASLVLLPDIRGMHAFYTDLALCFAQAGIDTVALDPYGRSAGSTARDDDFDYMAHAGRLTPQGLLADAQAARHACASAAPIRYSPPASACSGDSPGAWLPPTCIRPARSGSTGDLLPLRTS